MPSLRDWQKAMVFVGRATSACMWWYGDMLNYGEATYGELASENEGDGKYSYETLRKAKCVSAAVPLCIRMHNLSWAHHLLVAPLTTDEAKESWLADAAENKWSVSAMRKEMQVARPKSSHGGGRRTGVVTSLQELVDAGETFGCIYADPPWPYG